MHSDQIVSGLTLFLHDNSTYHQIKVVALGLYTVSLAIWSLFQAFCKVQWLCCSHLSALVLLLGACRWWWSVLQRWLMLDLWVVLLNPSHITYACLWKEFQVSFKPLLSWHIFTWYFFCSCDCNEILNILAIAQVVILLLSWQSSFTQSTFSAILLVDVHPEHLSYPSVVTPFWTWKLPKILLFPLSLS